MQEDNKIIYLDKEGYQEYKNSIDNLLVNLGRIEERMNVVKENGNALNEYEELLDMKERLKERILEKRNNLSKIKIVENNNDENILNIGDVVKIMTYYPDETVEEIYELVSGESDINSEIEKLSINSPKGKILYGASIGSSDFFPLSNEKIKVDILEKLNIKTLKKSI